MNDAIIMQDTATGEQIDNILKRIIPQVEAEPTNHVIIAALFLVLIAMNPRLEFDEIQRAIEATSQFVCLFLDNLDEERRKAAEAILDPSLDGFTPTTVN